MKTSQHNTAIKPTGSYFAIDADGYVINPTSFEKVQEEWRPVIHDVVEMYKTLYGEHLKNVYIRGSVAKGEAVKDVSDIDTFAYVDMSAEHLTESEIEKKMRISLEKKYDFVAGIEMGGISTF